jgi:cell division protease FtsH
VRYGQSGGDVFLGRDIGHQRDYSEDVAAAIDDEIRKLIDEAHHEAYRVLEENRDVLDALVVELLEKETLGKEEIERIFEPIRPVSQRPAWTGSERRVPSPIPPVEVPAKEVEASESEVSVADSTEGSDSSEM